MWWTLALPSAVFTTTFPSSSSTHTGVTWGDPSGATVARNPRLGSLNSERSSWVSSAATATLLRRVHPGPGPAEYQPYN